MRAMPMSTPSLLTQAGASGRAMARRNEHVRRLPAHSIDRRAFSAPPLPGHLVILTKLSPPLCVFAYYLCGWLCDLCGTVGSAPAGCPSLGTTRVAEKPA